MTDVMARSNDKGRPFAAVVVRTGDRYGRDFALTNEGATLVEFWDLMHPHAEVAPESSTRGQFVSRYFVDTLIRRPVSLAETGLCLDGGNADVWSIDAGTMADFVEWLEEMFPETESSDLVVEL